MPPHDPSIPRVGAGVSPKARPPRVEQEVTWGRMVFRPPALGNPQVVFDPLPFRTQHFAGQRGIGAK